MGNIPGSAILHRNRSIRIGTTINGREFIEHNYGFDGGDDLFGAAGAEHIQMYLSPEQHEHPGCWQPLLKDGVIRTVVLDLSGFDDVLSIADGEVPKMPNTVENLDQVLHKNVLNSLIATVPWRRVFSKLGEGMTAHIPRPNSREVHSAGFAISGLVTNRLYNKRDKGVQDQSA